MRSNEGKKDGIIYFPIESNPHNWGLIAEIGWKDEKKYEKYGKDWKNREIEGHEEDGGDWRRRSKETQVHPTNQSKLAMYAESVSIINCRNLLLVNTIRPFLISMINFQFRLQAELVDIQTKIEENNIFKWPVGTQ